MTQVGVDSICAEVEEWLRANLGGHLGDLKPVRKIVQGPSPDAVSTADYPVICISSPGMAEPPTRTASKYSATWTVMVTVWTRGETSTLSATARKTRDYVLAVRSCLLAWGKGTWTDEGYAQVNDRASSGTAGAGFVELSVFIDTAADLFDLPPGGPLPVVTSTAVSINPKE